MDKKKFFILICYIVVFSFYFSGSIVKAESLFFDTFEYFDSPLNHGWRTSDPLYPTYGYNVGIGWTETVIDFAEGSRVLNVYSNPSVFNQLEPYTIYNFNLIDQETSELVDKRILSFKINARFAVEYFAMFQFCVEVETMEGERKTLVYRAVEGPEPKEKGDTIDVCLGRQ